MTLGGKEGGLHEIIFRMDETWLNQESIHPNHDTIISWIFCPKDLWLFEWFVIVRIKMKRGELSIEMS